jgi:hypothetical protein
MWLISTLPRWGTRQSGTPPLALAAIEAAKKSQKRMIWARIWTLKIVRPRRTGKRAPTCGRDFFTLNWIPPNAVSRLRRFSLATLLVL